MDRSHLQLIVSPTVEGDPVDETRSALDVPPKLDIGLRRVAVHLDELQWSYIVMRLEHFGDDDVALAIREQCSQADPF